ncbi:hypothetical protein AB0F15_40650 [Amycolatopsis sp. NPDC026612]|uniref:hypothetical protein n=1 Tax=Amycolatopsis sp. NPDC026612 TaxID=3155466 RepID=UPI0033C87A6D
MLRLADIDGSLVVTRPLLPFTPVEFARAKAVLDLRRHLAGPPTPTAGPVSAPGRT